MRRYNFNYKKNVKNKYVRRELLSALVPSLIQTYALRKIFSIPGGEGKILNIDESMHYLCNPQIQTWQ